jgi:hypothetical protein
LSRPDTRFAAAISVAFLIVGAISVAFHEPWPDETQAWLIARDATGLVSLLRNSRYEGSPVLWHLLLLPITRLGWIPLMSALNLAFAAGAVFLFAGFSPFDRVTRALFAFGYLPLYEWGTIARNYAMGIFFLFLFAVLYPRRRPILQGLVLALAANTSAHAALLAASLLAFVVIDRGRWLGEEPGRPLRAAFWVGVSLAAVGLAVSAVQSVAPASVGLGWAELSGLRRVAKTAAAFGAGCVPLVHGWFNFLPIFQERWLAVPARTVTATVTVAFLATAGSYLAHRRSVWLIAVLSWAMLSCLFYCLWWSGPRHAGFLFMATLLALWLAPLLPERPPAEGRLARWGATMRRHLTLVTKIVLACQALAGVVAVAVEILTVFSAGRATARLIRDERLASLPMVGEPDMMASTVVAYLGLKAAYYPDSDRWGSFAVWDGHFDEKKRTADDQVFGRAVQLADRSDVLVVMNRAPKEGVPQNVGAVLVGQRASDVLCDESYWVYRVPRR